MLTMQVLRGYIFLCPGLVITAWLLLHGIADVLRKVLVAHHSFLLTQVLRSLSCRKYSRKE